MRMLVFFDLPTVTRADRRAYTQFRKYLINDGFDMIQYSVYGRIVPSRDAEEKHQARVIANLPPEGSVRMLTVTERQFAGMKILVGLPLFQEKKSTPIKCCCFKSTNLKRKTRASQGWARV